MLRFAGIGRSRMAMLICICALGSTASCRTETQDQVVAQVGPATVTLSELQRYLDSNLPDDAEEKPSEAELDRVRSRLLDQLLDEKLLLAEAERLGLKVSRTEVDDYLERIEEAEPGVRSADTLRLRVQVRRRLQIQKLQQHAIERLPELTPAQIRSRVGSLSRQPSRRYVILRSLEAPSQEEALEIRAGIKAGRLTFSQARGEAGEDPAPEPSTPVVWDSLPSPVRQAIAALDAGETSAPVELSGAVYLFEVESWITDSGLRDANLERLAVEALADELRETAYLGLLERLRRGNALRLDVDRLPFGYHAPVRPGKGPREGAPGDAR